MPYEEYDLLTADLVADVAYESVYEWAGCGLRAVKTPDGLRFRFDAVRRRVGGQGG